MAQHSMMTSLKISGSGTMPSNPLTAAHLHAPPLTHSLGHSSKHACNYLLIHETPVFPIVRNVDYAVHSHIHVVLTGTAGNAHDKSNGRRKAACDKLLATEINLHWVVCSTSVSKCLLKAGNEGCSKCVLKLNKKGGSKCTGP